VNVYVESNFVLELALLQEQHSACEGILSLCDRRVARLVLPAYSLVEPFETMRRHQVKRRQLKSELDKELRQLSRTSANADRLKDYGSITSLLVDSAGVDLLRLERVRSRLLSWAEVVPLDVGILERAASFQSDLGFAVQDAVIVASVFSHLEASSASRSCFLNRDPDFDDLGIREDLAARGCKLLRSFDHGLQFLRGTLNQETPS
jgi:predicted nucleic acid-binding protein